MSPVMDVRDFTNDLSNEDILNAIRNNASPDYQRRIPEATQANMQDQLQRLMEYRPAWNEFENALINVIGAVIVRSMIWTNPYSKWKRGMLTYGDTIEEINVGLIKAKSYNADREELEKEVFGTEKVDVQASFHKVNRMDRYKISVNQSLLQRAFNQVGGLSQFVTAIMNAPVTSDNWDEFLLMTSLFKEYYRNGGFFKVNVPDINQLDSTAPESKQFLRRVRGMADTLPFISTLYNAAGMPTFANRDELELFATPDAIAAIDVEALAGAFNVDRANIHGRINVIPPAQLGIPGGQAVLTTRDFFVVADQKIENTGIFNPATLTSNYWLHHWEVISASRYVPAILFTTEPSTPIYLEDTPVVGISTLAMQDEDGDVVTELTRGSMYQLVGVAVTDPEGGYNDAVRLEITSQHNAHTYITSHGVLHVALDEDASSVTIEVTALDDNTIQSSITTNVTGDKGILWPNPRVLPDADTDNIFEATPDAIVLHDTNKVTVPNVEGVDYKRTKTGGVAFTDAGDIVTVTGHGLEIGDKIQFGAITSTTGVTAATDYYVKTVPSVNTFTFSATNGGSTVALTTDGSAASLTHFLIDGETVTIAGTWVFVATAGSSDEGTFELTPGADSTWTITV